MQKLTNSKRFRLTKAALKYLMAEDCPLPPEEKKPIVDFLSKKFLISCFCYPFVDQYLYRKVPVYYDADYNLHYLYHNKNKLYFHRGLKKRKIVALYNSLCVEQHEESPHSYSSFKIDFKPCDIAVDAGAAEGIWGLNIVDRVKELYLFECEDEWIEALHATFAPWKDKVHIVKKFISNKTDKENSTLDDFFKEKNGFPTVLKADVEGFEKELTEGSSSLLTNSLRRVILCTYHKESDWRELSKILTDYKFNIESSAGYVTWIYSGKEYFSGDVAKIFRKALIYGYK